MILTSDQDQQQTGNCAIDYTIPENNLIRNIGRYVLRIYTQNFEEIMLIQLLLFIKLLSLFSKTKCLLNLKLKNS